MNSKFPNTKANRLDVRHDMNVCDWLTRVWNANECFESLLCDADGLLSSASSAWKNVSMLSIEKVNSGKFEIFFKVFMSNLYRFYRFDLLVQLLTVCDFKFFALLQTDMKLYDSCSMFGVGFRFSLNFFLNSTFPIQNLWYCWPFKSYERLTSTIKFLYLLFPALSTIFT